MKNKFEGFCYVCGEVVEEGKGLAEQIQRQPWMAGWGETTWSVRHTTCTPQMEGEQRPLSGTKEQK
jgi:hypothetical protein